jgi:hypothetical protein
MRSRPSGGTWVSFLPKIWGVEGNELVWGISLFWGEAIDETRRDETNHDKLAANIFDALDAVVVLALAESLRVDVGGEVAHGGSDAFVKGAAEGKMAAETHSCGALLWIIYVSDFLARRW